MKTRGEHRRSRSDRDPKTRTAEPGTMLELEEGRDSLLLKAETRERGSLIHQDGVLILGGKLTGPLIGVNEVRRRRMLVVDGRSPSK